MRHTAGGSRAAVMDRRRALMFSGAGGASAWWLWVAMLYPDWNQNFEIPVMRCRDSGDVQPPSVPAPPTVRIFRHPNHALHRSSHYFALRVHHDRV